jgi:hypothetical protein
MYRAVISSLLICSIFAGETQAGDCVETKIVPFDEFMGNGLSVSVPLDVLVPKHYRHAEIEGADFTYAYWMTDDGAKRAKRSGDLPASGFIYGKVSSDVGYDRERDVFTDSTGLTVREGLKEYGLLVAEQARVRDHTILFIEVEPKPGARKVYAAYVALNLDTNAVYLAYRPPAADPAAGECFWRAFKATMLASEASNRSATERIATGVLSREQWIADLKQCPRDAMRTEGVVGVGENRCARNDWSACLLRCREGSASDCYWLAQAVQPHLDEQVSEVLFARSCRLGVASGCTNRAAGMLKNAAEDEAARRCAHRTFEMTCAQGDPWGCTMQAFDLVYGIGVETDVDKARSLLDKSCVNGIEDEACASAVRLQEKLDEAHKP